ncbi:2-oxoacid:acceptor oxidoreductase subunit alpha [bacterium]|nr:MAG: 2-oxoacid:acceptor oxidoreductase subunit alpha [bacterium]
MRDQNVIIAGAAGEGIQSIGEVFSDTLSACGYGIFSWQEFESRIRGGQSSFTLRISDNAINAPKFEADILLALNEKALAHYRGRLRPGGVLLYEGLGEEEPGAINVRFSALAREWFGNRIYANSIAAGTLAGLLGVSLAPLLENIEKNFKGKEAAVISNNLEAAKRGYDLGKGRRSEASSAPLPCLGGNACLLTGHEALSLGAAWAGCRFICAYPMSPSTTIITFMAERQEALGIFVEQAEDEISAINMAIGASYAGLRAMTATSGGGFALMNEGVSLAGMTETPVVIVVAQRPGPATGLPTRTAQGDLLFAINSGHGEFPKAVLAPCDAKDAFEKAVRAFYLAEKFQTPVIILTDQFLADSRFSLSDTEFLKKNPGRDVADPEAVETPYLRYRFTESGISPRLFPGQSKHLVCVDSDEHDEAGHITEDLAGTAPSMAAKRLRKLEAMRAEMTPPEWSGPKDAGTVLVSWGSTKNSVLEALELLADKGVIAASLHFTELWPLPPYDFPAKVRLLCVESNSTGQLERLLAGEYGVSFDGFVHRADGLPMDGAFIAGKVLSPGPKGGNG